MLLSAELYDIAWKRCPGWKQQEVDALVDGWMKTYYHYVRIHVEGKSNDKTNNNVSKDIQDI